MVTMQNILDFLSRGEIVDALIATMEENFDDFAEDQKQYQLAVSMLQSELGDDSKLTMANEVDAIYKQTASNLFFSGFLGIKANLDNFINPINRNFLELTAETYLREDIAKTLPMYVHAQESRNQFYRLLSVEQKSKYEDIATFVSHLETVGPKLAHYCGYLLGNEFLDKIIPGYQPDITQTMQYCVMLEKYFGKRLTMPRPENPLHIDN